MQFFKNLRKQFIWLHYWQAKSCEALNWLNPNFRDEEGERRNSSANKLRMRHQNPKNSSGNIDLKNGPMSSPNYNSRLPQTLQIMLFTIWRSIIRQIFVFFFFSFFSHCAKILFRSAENALERGRRNSIRAFKECGANPRSHVSDLIVALTLAHPVECVEIGASKAVCGGRQVRSGDFSKSNRFVALNGSLTKSKIFGWVS